MYSVISSIASASASVHRRAHQRTGERTRPVIMRGKREVDELLDQLGILLVPRLEELQLAVGEVRLQAFDACELRSGMPDKLIGYGDTGGALAFTEHELKVRELLKI